MCSEASQILLAEKWDESIDPTGWWMSEKLDGVRAYWNGSKLYSRQGNVFVAPDYWIASLPKFALDGELWCGHATFSDCISIIKRTKNLQPEEWKKVVFVVFDAPNHGGKFEDRYSYLTKNLANSLYCKIIPIQKCKGVDQLTGLLENVVKTNGGEGIMLRKAQSLYERKRSKTLLKVKQWEDLEAKITGYKVGNSNHKHRHLICELPSGNVFSIGNGFTDHQHSNPPPIGTVITFKYQEFTHLGTPRFPIFLRVREDLTWEDVKKNWNIENNKQKNALKRGKSLLFDPAGSPKKTNDNGSPTEVDDDPIDAREMCKYGDKCYNKNAEHLQKYSHPASEAKKRAGTEGLENEPKDRKKAKVAELQFEKPLCPFGMQCTRKNPIHFEQFSHDPKQSTPPQALNMNNNNNFVDDGEMRYAHNMNRNGDPIDETKAEDDSEGTMVMDEFQFDNDMLVQGVLFASCSPKHEREKNELEESDETLCLVSQREYEEVVHRIEKLEELVRERK